MVRVAINTYRCSLQVQGWHCNYREEQSGQVRTLSSYHNFCPPDHFHHCVDMRCAKIYCECLYGDILLWWCKDEASQQSSREKAFVPWLPCYLMRWMPSKGLGMECGLSGLMSLWWMETDNDERWQWNNLIASFYSHIESFPLGFSGRCRTRFKHLQKHMPRHP